MKTFTAACKDFFGFKSGQTLKEFAAELRELSYPEKMDICNGLRAIGIECEDPQKTA